MKINQNKTEVRYVGRRDRQIHIEIGDVELNQVSEFKYLGVQFDKDNLQDTELNKRINKCNANVSLLYPILRARIVPRKCKITIFTTILRPILMYGSEAWSLTSRTR